MAQLSGPNDERTVPATHTKKRVQRARNNRQEMDLFKITRSALALFSTAQYNNILRFFLCARLRSNKQTLT